MAKFFYFIHVNKSLDMDFILNSIFHLQMDVFKASFILISSIIIMIAITKKYGQKFRTVILLIDY